MQSSTYCQAVESATMRRRGKFVYKTYKQLKEEYGVAIAAEIKARKLEQERSRKPGEQPFFCRHPEVQNDEDCYLVGLFCVCGCGMCV